MDFTGAVAVLLVLWWALDAPSAGQRRSLAAWVGGLGAHTAPSLEARTTRLSPSRSRSLASAEQGRARIIPAWEARLDDRNPSRKAGSPTAAVPSARPRADASPLNAGPYSDAPPNPSLERAYQIRDTAQFARAEVALRLALQDMPGQTSEFAAEETPEGLRIRLPARLFSGDDASAEAQRLIGAVAAAAAPMPNRLWICAGADEPGSAERDWDLPFARAAQARRLLEAKGVAPGRFEEISVRGGEEGLAVTILRAAPMRNELDP